ncbi:hypothetical protein SERLA73DRAFT_175450 [Serpula lacrymans var. lacrymans S7.3]|uniref:HAD-like protein n=2 Tax=Serpula lacrymans var. lacrymans TaxID=341189 RepID=F8PJX6_SERL3|nr:uncharacterized protein SERLADRAFT_457721 [Serpula lacrymans var. lacrymans S7.9]EGO03798.1 hypothetical protein SERLA73DRAFT_175450 [Serpula lacrymans var. lacrymans S7.3]EGO29660.1 hypothetical protein SERLADRAFT_457721 [Serpula lacrymans var. lacrymans S7.9]
MQKSLTSHRVLVLDVFGTLINVEQGIKSALSTYPPLSDTQKDTSNRQWSPNDALLAFASVEKDLSAQFPTMSYTDLLALAHRTLCRRVSGISDDTSQGNGNDPFEGEKTDAGAGPSTSATTEEVLAGKGGEMKSAKGTSAQEDDEHTAFAKHVLASPPFPDAQDGLRRLARHFQLVVLSNVDKSGWKQMEEMLCSPEPSAPPLTASSTAINASSSSPFSIVLHAQDQLSSAGNTDSVSRTVVNDVLKTIHSTIDMTPDQVIVVSHSFVPASVQVRSVWIEREGSVLGVRGFGGCESNGSEEGKKTSTWHFSTLSELADAVEGEIDMGKV